jgi:hypothetical protein
MNREALESVGKEPLIRLVLVQGRRFRRRRLPQAAPSNLHSGQFVTSHAFPCVIALWSHR